MALLFAKNNSLSAVTSLPASISGGGLNLISTQTASSSSTIDFTSGIDSTYKEYIFKFYDLHPSVNRPYFVFQADTGTNTNYNQTITSSYFQAYHTEAGGSSLGYNTSHDDAQSTSFTRLLIPQASDNDACGVGTLKIFEPSSTTFVKHFISTTQQMLEDGSGTKYSMANYKAGYFNTTNALTRFRFKFDSGNIDSGTIKLYGVT